MNTLTGAGSGDTGTPTSGPLPAGTYYQFGSVSNKPDYGEGWLAFTAPVVSSGVASATAWRCVMTESDVSGGNIELNSSGIT